MRATCGESRNSMPAFSCISGSQNTFQAEGSEVPAKVFVWRSASAATSCQPEYVVRRTKVIFDERCSRAGANALCSERNHPNIRRCRCHARHRSRRVGDSTGLTEHLSSFIEYSPKHTMPKSNREHITPCISSKRICVAITYAS